MNDFQLNRRQALIASGLGTLSLGMPGMVMGVGIHIQPAQNLSALGCRIVDIGFGKFAG